MDSLFEETLNYTTAFNYAIFSGYIRYIYICVVFLFVTNVTLRIKKLRKENQEMEHQKLELKFQTPDALGSDLYPPSSHPLNGSDCKGIPPKSLKNLGPRFRNECNLPRMLVFRGAGVKDISQHDLKSHINYENSCTGFLASFTIRQKRHTVLVNCPLLC